MFKGRALIVGASGGIGQELVRQLCESENYSEVHAVSRVIPADIIPRAKYYSIDSANEQQVAEYCEQLKLSGGQFSLVVCCIGALHHNPHGQQVFPEKRLEDINQTNLSFYFATNTIMPAIWLKNTEQLLKGPQPAKLVFFSARVGSITDNNLGGWYGYRASKSALNMLIKCAQVECQRRAKNISLISYHPGTVDTELSKPFQGNVVKDKLFSAEFTVKQLLSLTPNLNPEDGPHYIDWQGLTIPW
jgi:NAD(P)-dependent dehydrogenase (short-subunit alcohol dehydrogenase family)